MLALVLMVVGLVLTVMPGPAILFFLIAGGLLAAESRAVARWLDRGEVWLRTAWNWGQRHWWALPIWIKVALGVLVTGIILASACLSYRLLAG